MRERGRVRLVPPWLLLFLFALTSSLFALPGFAQTTIATGSIQGTITDPTGAVVPHATVTITNKATGEKRVFVATTTGNYSSGALIPGEYTVRVDAKGFKTTELSVTVQVGVTSTGNIKLEVGEASTVVSVTGTAVAVNTQQATVQNVLTRSQISNLPINGRNFLDLAQLTPGVQMQDGSNFDPTKNGFASISIAGQFGRTARIEVDGVDVSDETVGTVTENIPQSAIQEFSIETSTLDPSTELTSSGAVNIVTRSGTNAYHGDAFGLFRSSSINAATPGPPAPYSRSQFGGDVGGPILKNKLLFFADAERIVQAQVAPVAVNPPFTVYQGTFSSPYREGDLLGRLDYIGPHGLRMFYRFTYFKNIAVGSFGGVNFQPYKDVNQTRQHVVGADFATGNFTHSFRFSYLKFQNNLVDSVLGSQLPFANFPVSINFVDTGFATGPNLLAPQATPQSDHQLKYDGSWIHGNHIIRYGADYNHIQGGGYADFFGLTPNVFALASDGVVSPSCATSDPTCYPMLEVIVGNNQGFSTENPAFGFPAGGLGPDNRVGLYLADNWRVRPNLNASLAIRWVRDTGRTDSDLNTTLAINNYLPGLGNRVEQANNNLGPQLGIAWDPTGSGKTSIRIGAGLFFENVIYNNVLFDRPPRLPSGSFLQFPVACFSGKAEPVVFGATGPFAGQSLTIDQQQGNTGSSICGQSIGQAANTLVSFEKAYQQSWSVPKALPNPAFAPSVIASGTNLGLGLFAPGYKTPVSFQFNAGVQRQLMRNVVLSVDYLRNVNTHYLLGIDANHAGDVSNFNLTSAQQAIAATNAQFQCATIDCAIAAGASMEDYAANGLTSAADAGGSCQSALGTSYPCAFPGRNANLGVVPFLFPVGRSVYNAMMIKLTGNMNNVAKGIKLLNFQAGYTLSKFTNDGSTDQAFVNTAFNQNNPLAYTGYSSLDRHDMISFGGFIDVPANFRLGFIGHFFSPLPLTLSVPSGSGGYSQMFQTDFSGTGVDANTFTGAAILPGTTSGSFGRTISPGSVNTVLNAYNNAAVGAGCPAGMLGANCPTPAGQVLLSNGLFSLAQLQALGGVAPSVPLAPAGQNGLAWLKEMDVTLSWHYLIAEKVTVEPSVSFYNVFNFANFDLPGEIMSGLLTGSACSANGTVHGSAQYDCATDRVGLGTGVFQTGAPRQLEFGLKVTF
jgi:Carboxypeptidase regulatory-like domain